jgi:hypothetical protein
VQRVGGEHGLARHPVHAGRHHLAGRQRRRYRSSPGDRPLPGVGDGGVEQRGRRFEQPGGGLGCLQRQQQPGPFEGMAGVVPGAGTGR